MHIHKKKTKKKKMTNEQKHGNGRRDKSGATSVGRQVETDKQFKDSMQRKIKIKLLTVAQAVDFGKKSVACGGTHTENKK